MSSLTRRIQRKALRKRAYHEAGTMPFKMENDGGYSALHPTRGWKRFSAARLRAQAKLRALFERIEARRGRI